jgi:predicted nucleotidyltransferase
VSGDPPLIVLPGHSRGLLEATRSVLATPGMTDVALIGGLAVTMRISAAGVGHRATVDIDLVTIESDPEAAEILAVAHETGSRHLVIDGIPVDLIPTLPIDDSDLEGLEDKDRLFLAAHRWTYETAQASRIATHGTDPLAIRVATPAGLVATKSHAIANPTPLRRATKMASDLLDFFRLVDLYDRDGELADTLRAAPGEIAPIVADVARTEILANPAAATNRMASASPIPIDAEDVIAAVGAFVEGLRQHR